VTHSIALRKTSVFSLQRLAFFGFGGVLSLALAGCISQPPTPSMAPGPTVDHGFPGVSVNGNGTGAQWPTVHEPEKETEHRIYTEVPPHPPASHPLAQPASRPVVQPVKAPPAKNSDHSLQRNVYFSFNSTRLSYWDKVVIDRFATKAKKDSFRWILLHGSTDPLGSESYNKKLGLWRALSVKHYLISRGVPAKKIRALSWGDRKTRLFSACQKKSALCHSQSRSVRIDFVKK